MIRGWLLLGMMLVGAALALESSRAAEPAEMTVIEAGAIAPDIFIDVRATPPEVFAAQELRAFLEKLTGATCKIRTDYFIDRPPGKHIVIGHCRFAADLDTAGLGTEQYLVDVTPQRLAIKGAPDRQRGVLYGVYDLLERWGVRWYRPEPWGEHVPGLAAVRLPLGRTIKLPPDYVYRSVLAGGFTRNAEYTQDQSEWGSLWALRNRMNGPDPGSNARGGGQVSLQFDHVYSQLIPVEEYFDANPEYFCLYQGQRRRVNPDFAPRPDNPTGLQLCLSNSNVQKIFAEKIIAKARGRRDLASMSFSVTPNDACPFCECTACRAMDDPNDPNSMSNRVCAFTNAVARRVATEVPQARLSLNAYSAWTSPPTIVERLEPNVLIHIALINGWSDYTKPLDDPAPSWNATARDTMRRWQALGAKEIYTYEYWSGYGWPGPLPLARTMADRIGAYRGLGVRGIYNETAPHWGPQGLELFLFAKLIWNPDLDVTRELDLYYQNFYGPAAAPMKAYHETLAHALATSRTPVFSGGRGMHLVVRPQLIEELAGHISKAQSLAKGQPLFERRLKGVVAGHELAAAVSEIVRQKKRDGEPVSLDAAGSYLKSAQAQQAYDQLTSWLRRQTGEDAIFDVPAKGPLHYLEGDLLRNDAFQYLHEREVLADF